MSHEVESMFAAGAAPWHGLGHLVRDAQTSQTAIQLAGLDWRVNKVSLAESVVGGDGALAEQLSGYVGVERDTDKKLLGVVPQAYHPLQNAEAFKFFDRIVGQQKAVFHSAGSLYGGRKVWLLAKLPQEIRLFNGRDVTKCFLLLTHSHDADAEVTIAFTPVRVECVNTLAMALWGNPPALTVPKVKEIERYLRVISGVLQMAHDSARHLEEVANAMAATRLNASETAAYVNAVFEDIVPEPKRPAAKEIVAELIESGKGTTIPGVRGTLWGVYNAMVEYADHHIAYSSSDERLENVWYRGYGHVLKTNAYIQAGERIQKSFNWGMASTQQAQHVQAGTTW